MISSRNIENRVFWNPTQFNKWDDFKFGTPEASVDFLKASRTRFVHDIMSSFENIPITLPDTEEILSGKHNENISTKDYLRIRDFAKTIDLLAAAIAKKLFEFNFVSLKILHKTVARHELRPEDLGRMRADNVKLGSLDYKPPVYVALNEIWKKGFPELLALENPLERSVMTFLWLSRTQFFINCNKRTATLMMAGIQTQNSMPCVIFPEKDKKSFAREIIHFYESGNADRIIDLFREYHSEAVRQAKETTCLFRNTSSIMEERTQETARGRQTSLRNTVPTLRMR